MCVSHHRFLGRQRARLLLVAEGRLGNVGVRRGRRIACSPARARRASPTSRATCPPSSGSPQDPDPGLRDWLRIGPEAPTDALDRFAVEAAPGLSLLGAGVGNLAGAPPEAGAALAVALGADARPTIADAGVVAPHPDALHAFVEVADASVIVVRGCYLALRRAVAIELTTRATGAVFVDEPGRSLGPRDVASVLGVPVLATVAREGGHRAGGRRGRAGNPSSRFARPSRRERAAAHRRDPRGGGVTPPTAARPLRDALHRRLLAAPFDPAALESGELRARLEDLLRDEAPLVTEAAAASVVDDVLAEVEGLGPLQSLLADPSIVEIMVNGPDRVFVERNGGIEPVPVRLDAERSCASSTA